MTPTSNFQPIEPLFSKSILKTIQKQQDIPTGFDDLDKIIGGFRASNLIIVGGRPAMGCRSLILNTACHQAWEKKKVVCFFMTLTERNLIERIKQIYQYHGRSHTTPAPSVYIDYKLDIEKMRGEIARLKRDEAVDVVYVESVQMIGASEKPEATDQAEYAVKALWEMSREFDLPIVALSSLSRQCEIRGGDRRPLLCDLRESSTIEMYADVVLMLHRPEYYGILMDENSNSLKNVAEIIVVKNSNGLLKTAKIEFDKQEQVFDNELPPF